MLLNLVNNALTYTPEGGCVTPTLQQQQQVVILMTDTSWGIGPEDKVKIFDRFYRVDTARYRQTGNSGVGSCDLNCHRKNPQWAYHNQQRT